MKHVSMDNTPKREYTIFVFRLKTGFPSLKGIYLKKTAGGA